MALGKTNRVSAGKAYSAKLKTKRDGKFLDVAEFEISAKNSEGKYQPLEAAALAELVGFDGPVRDIAGDLVSLDTRIGTYEGDPIYNVSLGLKDAERNEIYFTEFIVSSNLGRGLSNTILNLKGTNDVQIGLYGQVGKDKKTYSAVSVRQGGVDETVKWKFDPKVTKELQPRLFEGKGGKQEKDWTAVDLWLFNQMKEFGEALKSNRSAQSESQVPSPESQESAPQNDEEALPF